jgi:hypothetical protein
VSERWWSEGEKSRGNRSRLPLRVPGSIDWGPELYNSGTHDGVQTAAPTWKSVKRIPESAIESRWGVMDLPVALSHDVSCRAQRRGTCRRSLGGKGG